MKILNKENIKSIAFTIAGVIITILLMRECRGNNEGNTRILLHDIDTVEVREVVCFFDSFVEYIELIIEIKIFIKEEILEYILEVPERRSSRWFRRFKREGIVISFVKFGFRFGFGFTVLIVHPVFHVFKFAFYLGSQVIDLIFNFGREPRQLCHRHRSQPHVAGPHLGSAGRPGRLGDQNECQWDLAGNWQRDVSTWGGNHHRDSDLHERVQYHVLLERQRSGCGRKRRGGRGNLPVHNKVG